jgi:hypothetical protein
LPEARARNALPRINPSSRREIEQESPCDDPSYRYF